MKTFSWVKNRAVLSALCATPILFSCAIAQAEETMAAPAAVVAAPAEPAPPYTLTYNLGIYSNYMFRGVDLSDGPALQGGVDFAHSSGFYLGTWFSNIDPYVNGRVDGVSDGNHLEVDLYGGYATTFANGLGLNFLGNYYWYPEGEDAAGTKNSPNSFEASVALSYKWFTYTYYRVLTDYYGVNNINGRRGDTKGADYNELKFNYKLPIADLNLSAKVGYQNTRHTNGDQGDIAIGINRDFSLTGAGTAIGGFNAGAVFTTTFDVEDEAFYLSTENKPRDTNEKKLTVYVKRSW